METLNLKDLKLTANESKDIIKFVAKKRNTTTKKILEAINQNQKCRINEKLTETQQKLTKTQQKLTETQQKLIKTQQKLKKITKITLKKYHKLTEKKQKNNKITEITAKNNKITEITTKKNK